MLTFDPETGGTALIASGLNEWAKILLDDFNVWTGFSVAHDWQTQHGPIPVGSRLLPITPFVLGGEFSPDNLRAIDSTEGMRYRASIAVRIRDLPDGTSIAIKRVEDEGTL